jgi:cytoskeletal protein RodZ
MDEIGLILREAREEKGLTVEEVQAITRINARYLVALEEGDYSALPTAVHVRGFLRNYARFLELQPEPLLERAMQLRNGNSGNHRQAPAEISPDSPLPVRDDQPFFDPVNVEVDVGSRRDPEAAVRLIIIAALIVAVALVVNRFIPLFLGNGDGSEGITENITAAVDEILNRPADPAEEGVVLAEAPDGDSPAAAVAPLTDSQTITSTSRVSEAAIILPTPTATRPVLPATMEQIALKIDVTERTWMEATIDGEVVYSGIARNGDTFEWTAEEEAKLLTGNAIGLFVTINEIPLGRLGGRGENREEIWRTTP